MSDERYEIVISIEGRDKFKNVFKDLIDQSEKASKSSEGLKDATDKSSGSFINLKNIVLGATTYKVATWFLDAANAAGRSAQQVDLLANALRTQGKYTPGAVKDLTDYANSMQKVTTHSNDSVVSVMKMYANYGITGETLKKLTTATLDYATATGVNLRRAVIQVGGALDGQSDAFQKYGITLKDGMTKTEVVNSLTSQLAEKFEGSAARATESYAGKVQKLTNDYDSMKQKVGEEVIPVLEFWIEKLNFAQRAILNLGNVNPVEGNSATEKRISGLNSEIEKINEIIERYNEFNKIQATPPEDAVGGLSLEEAIAQKMQLVKARNDQEVLLNREKNAQILADDVTHGSDLAGANEASNMRVRMQADQLTVAIGQMTTATYKQKMAALVSEQKMRIEKMKVEIKDEAALKQYMAASEVQLARQKFDLKKAEMELGLSTTQYMIGLAIDAFGKSKDLARAQLVVNQALAISRATQLIGIPFVGPALFAAATGLIVAATAKQWGEIGSAGNGMTFSGLSMPSLQEPAVGGQFDGVVQGEITGGSGIGDDVGPRVVEGQTGGVSIGGGSGSRGTQVIIQQSNTFQINMEGSASSPADRRQLVQDIVQDLKSGMQEAIDMAVQVVRVGEEFSLSQ